MAATAFPQDVATLLGRLRDRLAAHEDVVGVYVYGSLVTGDYSPAASDIDVIVLVQREPGQAMVRELTQMHTALAATGGPAGQLHCLYVAADSASDPDRLCTYWFGDRMTQWQMKLLTRAELATAGVALHGPWPPPGVEPVPLADLQAAVYEEATGYRRRISRQRRLWLQDTWIDHALVALPRPREPAWPARPRRPRPPRHASRRRPPQPPRPARVPAAGLNPDEIPSPPGRPSR
jgi:predicted nucleotidyltransferase